MSFRYGALTVLLGFEFNAAGKLLKAADQGDVDTVCRVLERKPQLAVFTGFAGTLSPLHRAVSRMDETMCRQILSITSNFSKNDERSVDKAGESLVHVVANQKSHRGLTPLMMACEVGSMPIVRMLLDAGADPREYDQYTSRTCLHYASLAGHATIVQFLTGNGLTVEHDGSMLPLRDCVMPDIQVGSSKFIDQRSFGGLTALHFAAVAGSLDCARILLQRGAAIMVKTDGDAFIGDEYLNPGSTPLHIAVLTNNIGIAHTIISAHAAMMSEGPSAIDGSAEGNGQRRGRRDWEGSSRTDIRSVRNSHRKLPYHLARERRRRDMMHLVDPRVNADFALDQARDAQLGLGAMRLSSICSQAIQASLLRWLDDYEKSMEEAEKEIEEGDSFMCEIRSGREGCSINDLVLPKLPNIFVRKPASGPGNDPTTRRVTADDMGVLDALSISPTYLNEVSPVAYNSPIAPATHRERGRGVGGVRIHGHHATADDFLLNRISTQLMLAHGDEAPLAGNGVPTLVGSDGCSDPRAEYKNNIGQMLPSTRPPMIRVQSENGLSQLAAFGRRRLGSFNIHGPQSGIPDTPDAMIKSESFDIEHEGKDSDSTGSGDKGSISGGSCSGDSMAGVECGVCLDATVEIEFTCGHQLCLDCSRSLTIQNKRPPICPFCRQEVYQFRRASCTI